MISALVLLSISLTFSGPVTAESGGYDYENPYNWADPQAKINNPQAAVLPKNWSPAPQPRSFQALVRDVFSERQAFFGLPLGLIAGVGGVSAI